jgi:hypothetical protein
MDLYAKQFNTLILKRIYVEMSESGQRLKVPSWK